MAVVRIPRMAMATIGKLMVFEGEQRELAAAAEGRREGDAYWRKKKNEIFMIDLLYRIERERRWEWEEKENYGRRMVEMLRCEVFSGLSRKKAREDGGVFKKSFLFCNFSVKI